MRCQVLYDVPLYLVLLDSKAEALRAQTKLHGARFNRAGANMVPRGPKYSRKRGKWVLSIQGYEDVDPSRGAALIESFLGVNR